MRDGPLAAGDVRQVSLTLTGLIGQSELQYVLLRNEPNLP
jgi:hypothetical protein